jgi:hypothetical protein
MSDELAVEPGATASVLSLAPGAQDLSHTERQVTGMVDRQTTSKWGTEIGPERFQSAYLGVLTEANTEIASLQRELSDYITAAKQVIDNFKSLDDENAHEQDVALAQQLTNAEEAHREREQHHRHLPKSTTTHGAV